MTIEGTDFLYSASDSDGNEWLSDKELKIAEKIISDFKAAGRKNKEGKIKRD